MLLRKLLQIRKADAELPKEIRAALIESLFAPIASLIARSRANSRIDVCGAEKGTVPFFSAARHGTRAQAKSRAISAGDRCGRLRRA